MTDRHVYLRTIDPSQRTSLSVLAGLVPSGSSVLDLGTGSGALGRHLSEHANCLVDGLTYNEQEGALARPHYRRVEVADLEDDAWPSLFSGSRYDFIVCADVLEHLRQPERVLAHARTLLSHDGKLLISVPNMAYGGLIAELLDGQFEYRDEGLLDRTHLRFFTRQSLQDFLRTEGWATDHIQAIDRPLIESEFQPALDRLPESVSRYLLARPDAAAYQLIALARPVTSHDSDVVTVNSPAGRAEPLFSCQLYVGTPAGFLEENKLVRPGIMGRNPQTLRFDIPPGPMTVLRLDPADRPGFLNLHSIRLVARGEVLWDWVAARDGLQALEAAPHRDIMLRTPWPGTAAMALLHGDDPWIELPIPRDALDAASALPGLCLEVELGWPMSADYLSLSELVNRQEDRIARTLADMSRVRDDLSRVRDDLSRTQHELAVSRGQTAEMTSHRDGLLAQAVDLRRDAFELNQKLDQLREDKRELSKDRAALEAGHARLLAEHGNLAEHLRWIESSTVFRASRPLVKAKIWMKNMLAANQPETPAYVPHPLEPQGDAVDIVVPVYRGLRDTQVCIASVQASTSRTPWRLVVVNDASPEPAVTAWLREAAAQDSRILLLENEHNLGFVGSVNRGMQASDTRDVLLLNSDTEVANDWLDRIRRAAYSDRKVASVTPFSNNATICSYPRFCEANELPAGHDTASLDRLFAQANQGEVTDVPTGVGFCMYVRRDCLQEVGLFDEANFGKGYGEENDFCRRAAAVGWRNLHALDTFVLHTGGVSFGDSKSQREIEAVNKLRRLHPSYDRVVHAYVATDPAGPARLAVDLARVQARAAPAVLAVLHNRSGGTVRHALELAEHLHARATFFALSPAPNQSVWLELLERGNGFRLEFSIATELPRLLEVLRDLGVVHVHFHHVLGHADAVLRLPSMLGVDWDYTLHDYYAMCPQISLTDTDDRYCGEDGSGNCRQCTKPARTNGTTDIASWRSHHRHLVADARHVLAPSLDAARRAVRMWPDADIRVAPHLDLCRAVQPTPQVQAIEPGKTLKVVVVGALSRIKGADVLEDVGTLAARQGAPVEFHLIGHAYHELRRQPKAALTVHGPYEDKDLPGLLQWAKPDVVWFPALWPETYSYTLSACLALGLPVVAPDIGAFPERLSARRWSWVMPWNATPTEWLDFFVRVRDEHFVPGVSPLPCLASASDVDKLIKPWSYDEEYLAGIEARNVRLPHAASMTAFLPSWKAGTPGTRAHLQHVALDALVRLRSMPGLRGVARLIPMRWQRAAKSWLKA